MNTGLIYRFCSVGVLLALLAPMQYSASAPANETLVLHVYYDAPPDGNGTSLRPFRYLPDAIDSARHQAGPNTQVVIDIAPGEYMIESTLHIDFPVEIKGAVVPVLDLSLDQWPTGGVQADTETKLIAQECNIVDDIGLPLIMIGNEMGHVVRDVSIRNLVLQGTSPECPVLQIHRTQNVLIANNIVLGEAQAGIDVAASSGIISGNYVASMDNCGICVAAGTTSSPADVTITDNRSENNNAGGLLLVGSTFPLAQHGDQLDANVLHNDLSLNTGAAALGFGLRIIALGPELSSSQIGGRVSAQINDNRIADNLRDFMFDAGFTARNIRPNGCDKRDFTGQFDLSLRANTFPDGRPPTSLVTFTRGQVVTKPDKNPFSKWHYLHGATFTISDPDLILKLNDVDSTHVVDHPMVDPFMGGDCNGDATSEPLWNKLIYNGIEIPSSNNNP